MRFTKSISIIAFSITLTCLLSHAASATVKSGFVELRGGRLYYEEQGSGPAVVLIHGGQLDGRMWDEQFDLLARDHRVIRYDVRGFGKSPAPAKPYADEEDLYDLLKSLGVARAALVGLSLGGRISIDFALVHPEMVSVLVPVAPGLSGFPFSGEANEQAIFEAVQQGDWTKSADYWLKTGYMAPAMENLAIAARIRQLAIENAHEGLDNPLFEIRLKPRAITRLEQIKAPTLIIVGDRDVSDIHQIVGLLRARIPDSDLVVIKGAGHMVSMEKPKEFNETLVQFLGKSGRL